jgi:uncharacterized protein YndB with AHSA1/START domain
VAREIYDELAGNVAVERSVQLGAAPERVWRHLVEGDLLSTWMGGEVSIEPRPGGAIRMAGNGAAAVWGAVEEIVPRRRIQWCWRTDDGMPTLVEIELDSEGSGTRLTVRETLLPWQVTEATPRWSTGPGFRRSGAVSAAA